MTNLDAASLGSCSFLAWIGLSLARDAGLVVLAMAVGLGVFVFALPWIVQPFLRVMLSLRYNLRVIGRENIPRTGGVLVVSNHLSWYDGFFLAATLPRKATALVNANVFGWPVIGFLARRCGLISVPFHGPKAQRASIETCRKILDGGGLLGIFPEGLLTRNGMTTSFRRGLEVILAKREQITVIPVYLDNVWGSMMSFSEGRFFTKWPKGWRRTVVISFGRPVEPPVDVFKARQAVLVAGVAARAALGFTSHSPTMTTRPSAR
jgi:acyl-[acyl-carrier-protein]-phospholipid O-acyltransferase/long-chain-fatty-acid--[acyl-carrier-protein] ligase